jgi:hypothetical protein
MKERSYQQATKFSWENSVRRILDVYREVGKSGKRSDKSAVENETHVTTGVA